MQIMISKNYTGIISQGSDNYPKLYGLNIISLEISRVFFTERDFSSKWIIFKRKILQNKENPKIFGELILTPGPYITFMNYLLQFFFIKY